MLEAVGHSVRGLRRVAFGPLKLDRLASGESRALRPNELDALRKAVQPASARPSRGATPPRRRGGRSGTP
jgi:hypothetical protein